MQELQSLIDKIVDTIQRDVNNIFVKASGAGVLPPEHQDSLVKYFKVLTDHKLSLKEKELEEKIKRAEDALAPFK